MSTILRSINYLRKMSGRRLSSSVHRVVKLQIRPCSFSINTNSEVIRCITSTPNNRNYVTDIAVEKIKDNANETIDQKLNDLDYRLKVHGTVMKNQFQSLLNMVKEHGTLTSREALFLIRCCGQFLASENVNIRRNFLNDICRLIKELNVPIDISHYNAMLLVNLENETNFSAIDFLLELKTENIKPNRVTFQRLIEHYCANGDIAGATKILEHMKEEELPLNETIFSLLIRGHSETGNILEAVTMLDIMKQAGIDPSSIAYNAVLCAHAKRGDLETIESVLFECKEKNIEFLDKDFLDIIYTLAINEHLDEIDQVMSFIVKGPSYNKNAIQIIYKLIEKNHVEAAFKLLQSLTKSNQFNNTENVSNSGNFFIRKLVCSNLEVDTIIHYFNLMVTKNINITVYESALYIALKEQLNHLALPLMKAWKISGGHLKEYHFYPLFAALSKHKNQQDLLNCLKTMISEYRIRPNFRTLCNYILPHMSGNPVDDVKTLIENKVPMHIATNAMILHLLNNKEMKLVDEFMQNINSNTYLQYPFNELVENLINSCDFKSYVRIVCHYHNHTVKQELNKKNSVGKIQSPQIIDRFTITAVEQLSVSNIPLLKEVLNEMVQNKMNINEQTRQKVTELLRDNVDAEIENVLSKLTSSSVESTIITTTKTVAQNENDMNFKMMLIQQNCDSNNFSPVEELISELEQHNPTYTISFCLSLINYYLKKQNLEKAELWFNKAQKLNPRTSFKKNHLLYYSELLVLNNRFSDALKVLEFPAYDSENERIITCGRLIYNVSNMFPDQLQEFIKVLQEKGFIQNLGILHLRSMVKEPIMEGNMKKALENFQWVYKTYNLVPQKNVLIQKFIAIEDAESLQTITNILTEKFGAPKALFNLALGFLECDRFHQARKILQTPGMRYYDDQIKFAVDNYIKDNRTDIIEKLMLLIKGSYSNLDRIYLHLLEIYEQNNDLDKALKLWTQLQEDNIQPSKTFMTILEKIKNNNDPKNTNLDSDASTNFHNALISGNVNEAKNYFKIMSPETKNLCCMQLIDAYLTENNVQESLSLLNEMLNSGVFSIMIDSCRVIASLFKKLVEADDFQTIWKLMLKLNNLQNKSPIDLVKKDLNLIYLNSGKYLLFLEHLIDITGDISFSKSDMTKIFDYDVAIRTLEQSPELKEDFKKFACKVYDKKIYEPITALWLSEFLNNSSNAEKLWDEYLKNNIPIRYFPILYSCCDRGAWDKLVDISEKMQNHSTSWDTKKKFYRTLLKLLLQSNCAEKYNLAFECLQQAVKTIPIETFDQKLMAEIETNLTNGQTLNSLKEKKVHMAIE